MFELARDYFLFVFAAALGMLQIAGTHNRLRGILFIRKPAISYLVGVAMVTLPFLWFFGTGNRNLRGLEGLQQFVLFLIASGTALTTSLVGSSVLHRVRPLRPETQSGHSEGLETLRELTYFQAVSKNSPWRKRHGSRLRPPRQDR